MRIANLSELLLHATYQGGVALPSKLTQPHERAEKHSYKTQYLFRKGKKIPRNLYVARLIEHYVIFKALEKKLKDFEKSSEIAPFFALNFFKELARTPVIVNDLEQLGVQVDGLDLESATAATRLYVQHICELKQAKAVLVHYALHVAGLMHGGRIIQSQFFAPSNKLPGYQVPSQEYDFSAANRAAGLSENAPTTQLFSQMSKRLEEISIDDAEAQPLLREGLLLYSSMANIYDDLLWSQVYVKKMHQAIFFIVLAAAWLACMASKYAMLDFPELNKTCSA